MPELELIAAIEAALRRPGKRVLTGPGDDAAVVRAGGVAVTSVDTLAEGVHFTLATHSHADVGHKALAAALSDIAAMGAEPGEAYVALVLPPGASEQAALELVAGMDELAGEAGCAIVGGDVTGGPGLVVSVTVTGWADSEEQLVYRSGARPGDLLGATGALGGSECGRLLLDGLEAELAPDRRDELLARHRRPVPLIAAGKALAGAGATAMIDVSDGVATDAAHLAERSELEVSVRMADLALAPGVDVVAAAAGRDAAELGATGGEDYELLFTAAPGSRPTIEEAAAGAGASVAWIGEAASGSGLRLLDAAGQPVTLRGYEHLAG
jgi:thiamine-monophosphate kinase